MKRLLILSGKGGTGKTTVAASLIALSRARAFADCDVDAPNLHLVTAREGEPTVTDFLGGEKARTVAEKCTGCGMCAAHCRFGAVRVEDGRAVVDEYACEGCGVCVQVCPAGALFLSPDVAGRQELYEGGRIFSTAALKMGRGNSGKLVTAVKLSLLKHAPGCELAVFDGSPGIGCPVTASLSGMDLALIVAEPSRSGRSDLERLVQAARPLQTKLAVCVNKWDVNPEETAQIERSCSENALPFLGKIPYDQMALDAISRGEALVEVPCPARDALEHIYHAVCGLLGINE